MIPLIDVSPGRSVLSQDVSSALARATMWARGAGLGMPANVASNRADMGDATWIGGPDMLDAYQRHVDGQVLQKLGNMPRFLVEEAARNDALPIGAGGFPRDFEFIRSRIYEEARQPLTAMEFFPVDSSVPLGAKRHTARRALGSGEAQILHGGTEFPRARTTYAEETFNVAYVVCAVETNFFEALTTDWAGLQQYQRDLRLAFRLVDERMNRIAWFGDPAAGLSGVLDYPHLAKMVVATAFTDATAPEDVATALADIANTPLVESSGTFQATEMLVSPRIAAFIFTRPTTLASNMFIAQLFLAGQTAGGGTGGIRRIRIAPELAGIGPNGEDGILIYRPEVDTIGHVVVQAPTTLPVFQSTPIEQITLVFGATGGVVMPDVGNALLALVDVTP